MIRNIFKYKSLLSLSIFFYISSLLYAIPHVPGALIIKTKQKTGFSTLSTTSEKQTIEKLNKKNNLISENKIILSSGIGVQSNQNQTLILKFDESTNIESLSKEYKKIETVEYAEPIYYVNLYNETNSNPSIDPKSYENNQEYINKTSLQHIYKLNSKRDITVAIIDSGVDIAHNDLKTKIYINKQEIINNIDDDGNGFIDDRVGLNLAGYYYGNYSTDITDDKGHGTHLAGVIAANNQNNIGIKGITNKVKILPIKITNKSGKATQVDAAMAIKYAVDSGAEVINCSWGFKYYNQVLKQVIDYATKRGVTVICAAGNGYQQQKVYPAAFDNTIAVGSVNINHYKSDFSNWGEHIDFVFYGENIFSLNTNNAYSYRSGTSMATALFAGVCAKVFSSDKSITNKTITSLLEKSTLDINKKGKDSQTGNGILDIKKLLANLDSSFNAMFNPTKSTPRQINTKTSSDPITGFLDMLLDSPSLLAGIGAGLLLISIVN